MPEAPTTTTDQPRRRFHRATWNALTAIDARLLDALAYLCKLKAQQSASGARYATPGRAWLAAHLDCSVETITRHTTKLAGLGLLSKLQRRPHRGRWQTNLYRLVNPMAWQAAALMRRVRAASSRLSKLPAKGSPRRVDQIAQGPKESLRDIIARGLSRWGPPSTI